MSSQSELMASFLELSVALTGFSEFHLQGTGQAEQYYATVEQNISSDLLVELLKTFQTLKLKAKSAHDDSVLTTGLRSEILGSEKLGAIARNIIKLWYVATWYPLPASWQAAFGTENSQQHPYIVAPQAYPEGLVWSAIGVNPPGAKAPGFGTWSEPPSVSLS
ncbi:MAG: hypothetical protein AAGF83_04040 [Cyanobacteria bacterium P01_G01_bin.67]